MTHEKIFKILLSTTLALILVILGVGYVFYYKYLDQVTLQHDNEQISKYKRSLDYSSFGIDDFSNRYQELEPALAYANIEAIQSGISAGDYSCQEVVQFYVYRIKQHEAYNAVLELNDAAMDHASRIDKKIKNNEANSLVCTVVNGTVLKQPWITSEQRHDVHLVGRRLLSFASFIVAALMMP